jgi:hypothetical protein
MVGRVDLDAVADLVGDHLEVDRTEEAVVVLGGAGAEGHSLEGLIHAEEERVLFGVGSQDDARGSASMAGPP